ncbi:MAG: alpha/beta fold hydrolase [Planctomycetaceae bacterium]
MEAAAGNLPGALPGSLPDGTPPPACPPPLFWRDIVQRVAETATAWTLERPGTVLSGQTLGNGPPLLLLNGLGEPRECQFLLAWLLREQFRCVMFDWRGVRTPAPRPTLETLADDLLDIADHWPGEANLVWGSGLGGLVALRAARRAGSRFRKLLLAGVCPHRTLSWGERLLCGVGSCLPGPARWVPGRSTVYRLNHRRWFPPLDPDRYRFLLDLSGRCRVAGLANLGRVVGEADLRAELAAISTEVVLLSTEGQWARLREGADQLEAGLPHVSRTHLHSTGLLPGLTHPHRLAAVIREQFLGPAPASSPRPAEASQSTPA